MKLLLIVFAALSALSVHAAPVPLGKPKPRAEPEPKLKPGEKPKIKLKIDGPPGSDPRSVPGFFDHHPELKSEPKHPPVS